MHHKLHILFCYIHCLFFIFFFSLSVISENLILSLNEEYLSRDSVIDAADGDEIAVIPPISGG